MAILKSELYAVISKKESEIRTEYLEKERQIKMDAINAFYENEELDETLELFVKQLQEIKKTASLLEPKIQSYYTPIHTIDNLDWFDDVDAVQSKLTEAKEYSNYLSEPHDIFNPIYWNYAEYRDIPYYRAFRLWKKDYEKEQENENM